MDNQQRRDFWKQKVAEIQASGQPVAAWVRNQEEYTLYQVRYWIRKFREESKLSTTASSSTTWMPVDAPSSSSQYVTIHLPNGSRMDIPPGLHVSELSNLFRAVNDV